MICTAKHKNRTKKKEETELAGGLCLWNVEMITKKIMRELDKGRHVLSFLVLTWSNNLFPQ
jgi:hypothetical protein